MQEKTSRNSSPKAGVNTVTTHLQGKHLSASEKSFSHGIEPSLEIEKITLSDILGPSETVEIWHNQIGKQPPFVGETKKP
jgi:hypothetical protein